MFCITDFLIFREASVISANKLFVYSPTIFFTGSNSSNAPIFAKDQGHPWGRTQFCSKNLETKHLGRIAASKMDQITMLSGKNVSENSPATWKMRLQLLHRYLPTLAGPGAASTSTPSHAGRPVAASANGLATWAAPSAASASTQSHAGDTRCSFDIDTFPRLKRRLQVQHQLTLTLAIPDAGSTSPLLEPTRPVAGNSR
jgi:hypothetical protein